MNMKFSAHLTPVLLALALAVTSTGLAAGGSATNAPGKLATPTVEIAKSTFVMPKDKKDGRDPFHPASMRPFEQASIKPGSQPVAAAVDLQLKAIGGSPGNRIATINTRNFAKGEDGEMNTTGGRIQIHIVDILDDAVIVTVNGEQRELRFRRSFQ